MIPIFAHAYSHRMMKSFKCDKKYEEMVKLTRGTLNGKIRKAIMNKVIYFKGQKAFSDEDNILVELKYSRNQIGCCLKNSRKNRADIIVTFMIDEDQYVYTNPPSVGAPILFQKNNQDINKDSFLEEVFDSEVEVGDLEDKIVELINEGVIDIDVLKERLRRIYGEIDECLIEEIFVEQTGDPEAADTLAKKKAMFRSPCTRPPLNIDNVTDLSFETRQLVCDILDNLPEDRTFILNGESKKLSEDEKADVRNFIDFYRKYEVDQDREDEVDMIRAFNASDEAVQNLILRVSEFKDILGPVTNLVRQMSEVSLVDEEDTDHLEKQLSKPLDTNDFYISKVDTEDLGNNRSYLYKNPITKVKSDDNTYFIRPGEQYKNILVSNVIDDPDEEASTYKKDTKKRVRWWYKETSGDKQLCINDNRTSLVGEFNDKYDDQRPRAYERYGGNFKPSNYQLHALKYGGTKILLAHRPGFGKTINCILNAEKLRNSCDEPKPKILIVAPSRKLVMQWVVELKRLEVDMKHYIWCTYKHFETSNTKCLLHDTSKYYPDYEYLDSKEIDAIENMADSIKLKTRSELKALNDDNAMLSNASQRMQNNCMKCGKGVKLFKWDKDRKDDTDITYDGTTDAYKNEAELKRIWRFYSPRLLRHTIWTTKNNKTSIELQWRLMEDKIFFTCEDCGSHFETGFQCIHVNPRDKYDDWLKRMDGNDPDAEVLYSDYERRYKVGTQAESIEVKMKIQNGKEYVERERAKYATFQTFVKDRAKEWLGDDFDEKDDVVLNKKKILKKCKVNMTDKVTYKVKKNQMWHMYRPPKDCIFIADEIHTVVKNNQTNLLSVIWKYCLQTKFTIFASATPVESKNEFLQLYLMSQMLKSGKARFYKDKVITPWHWLRKWVPNKDMFSITKSLRNKFSRYNTVENIKSSVEQLNGKVMKDKEKLYELDNTDIINRFMGVNLEKKKWLFDGENTGNDYTKIATTEYKLFRNAAMEKLFRLRRNRLVDDKLFPDKVAYKNNGYISVSLDRNRASLLTNNPIRELRFAISYKDTENQFRIDKYDNVLVVKDSDNGPYNAQDILHYQKHIFNKKDGLISMIYNNDVSILGNNAVYAAYTENTNTMGYNKILNTAEKAKCKEMDTELELEPIKHLKWLDIPPIKNISDCCREEDRYDVTPYIPGILSSKVVEIIKTIEKAFLEGKNVMVYHPKIEILRMVQRGLAIRNHVSANRLIEREDDKLKDNQKLTALRRWDLLKPKYKQEKKTFFKIRIDGDKTKRPSIFFKDKDQHWEEVDGDDDAVEWSENNTSDKVFREYITKEDIVMKQNDFYKLYTDWDYQDILNEIENAKQTGDLPDSNNYGVLDNLLNNVIIYCSYESFCNAKLAYSKKRKTFAKFPKDPYKRIKTFNECRKYFQWEQGDELDTSFDAAVDLLENLINMKSSRIRNDARVKIQNALTAIKNLEPLTDKDEELVRVLKYYYYETINKIKSKGVNNKWKIKNASLRKFCNNNTAPQLKDASVYEPLPEIKDDFKTLLKTMTVKKRGFTEMPELPDKITEINEALSNYQTLFKKDFFKGKLQKLTYKREAKTAQSQYLLDKYNKLSIGGNKIEVSGIEFGTEYTDNTMNDIREDGEEDGKIQINENKDIIRLSVWFRTYLVHETSKELSSDTNTLMPDLWDGTKGPLWITDNKVKKEPLRRFLTKYDVQYLEKDNEKELIKKGNDTFGGDDETKWLGDDPKVTKETPVDIEIFTRRLNRLQSIPSYAKGKGLLNIRSNGLYYIGEITTEDGKTKEKIPNKGKNKPEDKKYERMPGINQLMVEGKGEREKVLNDLQFRVNGMVKTNRLYYAVLTGNVKQSKYPNYVEAFSTGKINCLFVNGAGIEGIDYQSPSPSLMICVSPETFPGKQDQFVGRTIRRNSHETLPDEMKVTEYVSFYTKEYTKPSDEEEDLFKIEDLNMGLIRKEIKKLKPKLIEKFKLDEYTDEVYKLKVTYLPRISKKIKENDEIKEYEKKNKELTAQDVSIGRTGMATRRRAARPLTQEEIYKKEKIREEIENNIDAIDKIKEQLKEEVKDELRKELPTGSTDEDKLNLFDTLSEAQKLKLNNYLNTNNKLNKYEATLLSLETQTKADKQNQEIKDKITDLLKQPNNTDEINLLRQTLVPPQPELTVDQIKTLSDKRNLRWLTPKNLEKLLQNAERAILTYRDTAPGPWKETKKEIIKMLTRKFVHGQRQPKYGVHEIINALNKTSVYQGILPLYDAIDYQNRGGKRGTEDKIKRPESEEEEEVSLTPSKTQWDIHFDNYINISHVPVKNNYAFLSVNEYKENLKNIQTEKDNYVIDNNMDYVTTIGSIKVLQEELASNTLTDRERRYKVKYLEELNLKLKTLKKGAEPGCRDIQHKMGFNGYFCHICNYRSRCGSDNPDNNGRTDLQVILDQYNNTPELTRREFNQIDTSEFTADREAALKQYNEKRAELLIKLTGEYEKCDRCYSKLTEQDEQTLEQIPLYYHMIESKLNYNKGSDRLKEPVDKDIAERRRVQRDRVEFALSLNSLEHVMKQQGSKIHKLSIDTGNTEKTIYKYVDNEIKYVVDHDKQWFDIMEKSQKIEEYDDTDVLNKEYETVKASIKPNMEVMFNKAKRTIVSVGADSVIVKTDKDVQETRHINDINEVAYALKQLRDNNQRLIEDRFLTLGKIPNASSIVTGYDSDISIQSEY